MPIADTKKCQTLINVTGQQMQIMQAALDKILAMKAQYLIHNPSTVGTPLDGNIPAINSWIANAETLMAQAVVTQMVAAIVPTHQNKALD